MVSLLEEPAPIIFAHRGASRLAPENTLAAFKKAHSLGARAVELDVQLTQDLVPVVLHDETLIRTIGIEGHIADTVYAAVQHHSAGAWFDPLHANERMLSLAEILNVLLPLGLLINIEIKSNAQGAKRCTNKILQVIQEIHAPHEQIYFSSFEPAVVTELSALKKTHSHFPAYALICAKDFSSSLSCATDLGCFGLHPEQYLLAENPQAKIQSIKATGLKLFPFTVNELSVAQHLLTLGADGFFTDNEQLYECSNQTPKITLTAAALQQLEKLCAGKLNAGLLIHIKTTGCSGNAYDLSIVERSTLNLDTHQIYLQPNGLFIAIIKTQLTLIQGSILDYLREGLNTRFKFINPNEKATCGCGESFMV